ncbi:hypothetical protein COOONC_14422 [Cooperia oncophora]
MTSYQGRSISEMVSLILSVALMQCFDPELQMVSVERIVQYTELESEHDSVAPLVDVPKSWPSEGHVTITNMFLKYNEGEDGDFVLKNICLDIKPKEKIGIVGRTGAGKSSLLRALFRLTPPVSGNSND